MKKMLLATALALLITGCTTRRLLFKQTGSSRHQRKTITHHFVSGIWAEENCQMQPKFVAAQHGEEQKPSKHS